MFCREDKFCEMPEETHRKAEPFLPLSTVFPNVTNDFKDPNFTPYKRNEKNLLTGYLIVYFSPTDAHDWWPWPSFRRAILPPQINKRAREQKVFCSKHVSETETGNASRSAEIHHMPKPGSCSCQGREHAPAHRGAVSRKL